MSIIYFYNKIGLVSILSVFTNYWFTFEENSNVLELNSLRPLWNITVSSPLPRKTIKQFPSLKKLMLFILVSFCCCKFVHNLDYFYSVVNSYWKRFRSAKNTEFYVQSESGGVIPGKVFILKAQGLLYQHQSILLCIPLLYFTILLINTLRTSTGIFTFTQCKLFPRSWLFYI